MAAQDYYILRRWDTAAVCTQFVDEAPTKHGKTFHSTYSLILQRCTPGHCTSWVACHSSHLSGLIGGIDARCQRLFRWQLSGIFSGQLPPRASRPSSSTRARSARRPEVSRRPHSSNSTPYPPSCRLFTRRTEPLSGASSLDRTAADGARWTTELPGLATDAVDTAGGLAVARHRLRCTLRRWAA